jgi:hypothetical protein
VFACLLACIAVQPERASSASSLPDCSTAVAALFHKLGVLEKPQSRTIGGDPALWDERYHFKMFDAAIELSGSKCEIEKILFWPSRTHALTIRNVNAWLAAVTIAFGGGYPTITAISRSGRSSALTLPKESPVLAFWNFAGSFHASIADKNDLEGAQQTGIATYRGTPFYFRVDWPEPGSGKHPLWPDCP